VLITSENGAEDVGIELDTSRHTTQQDTEGDVINIDGSHKGVADLAVIVNHVPVIDLLQYDTNMSVTNGSLADRIILIGYMLTKEPWCLVVCY